jgi:hypothetical protein
MKFKWNWKQNSNVIENEIIENKIYHTKLNTKFKWISKQNWQGNPIPNEIQIASCVPKQVFIYGSGQLKQLTLKIRLPLW